MSESTANLKRKLASAGDLQAVVRTMKAIAGSQIVQYENAVRALGDYHGAVERGLSTWFREAGPGGEPTAAPGPGAGTAIVGAVVFGSDQGLVGQFNQTLARHVVGTLSALPGPLEVWAVGERVHARLEAEGLPMMGLFPVPGSVQAIVPLVGRIQVAPGVQRAGRPGSSLYVFHNRPRPDGLYGPVGQRLLPLDTAWQQGLANVPWPNHILPEVLPGGIGTLRALIGEYLFISVFRACAESLASENASRLAAMERADRNITELSEGLLATFHRLRQDGIDEELFDVVAGYKALGEGRGAGGA